jgi:hypothetical protein
MTAKQATIKQPLLNNGAVKRNKRVVFFKRFVSRCRKQDEWKIFVENVAWTKGTKYLGDTLDSKFTYQDIRLITYWGNCTCPQQWQNGDLTNMKQFCGFHLPAKLLVRLTGAATSPTRLRGVYSRHRLPAIAPVKLRQWEHLRNRFFKPP